MKTKNLINLIIVTAIILFLTPNCKKEKVTSLPVLSTTAISVVADNHAESKSKVITDGGANITSRGVCWNISPDPSISDSKTVDDGGVGTYFSKITGLTAGTEYHLKAYATNANGTSYSEEITFLTKATLPIISTTPVTDISNSSVTCGGKITYDGGASITSRGVCWGTTVNPTTSNLKTTDSTGIGRFISKIDGLTAGTLYHIRAYATNYLGTAYGSDITFSTKVVLPAITTSLVTAITSTTAVSGGTITLDGGASITARGVCWSLNANPTTSDSKSSDSNGMGQFVSSLSGLIPGTTYHLRAYATNSAGTAYGNEISFNTPAALPVLATSVAASIITNNCCQWRNCEL
jgi:predicted phage tail protein